MAIDNYANSISLPRIAGVASATPSMSYGQEEVLDILGINDRKIRGIFLNGGIERRHLSVPVCNSTRSVLPETQGQLLHRHREYGVLLGAQSIRACLKKVNALTKDIGFLCCVTTTGMLTPSLSVLLCQELNLDRECHRIDIVGMGCSAGLNGLNAATAWARSNIDRLAVLVCVEVCSAAYVLEETMGTAVVNSLFGDGAGAVAVKQSIEEPFEGPTILKFSTWNIIEEIEAMKFEWNDDQHKLAFRLDKQVPYVIGSHAERAINSLLSGTGIRKSEIKHWIIHSGGKKVLDSIKINVGLTAHDIRHTSSVLKNYGNVSSGSFLFSYEKLIDEKSTERGDYGVMMTMGPGSTIETGLIRW